MFLRCSLPIAWFVFLVFFPSLSLATEAQEQMAFMLGESQWCRDKKATKYIYNSSKQTTERAIGKSEELYEKYNERVKENVVVAVNTGVVASKYVYDKYSDSAKATAVFVVDHGKIAAIRASRGAVELYNNNKDKVSANAILLYKKSKSQVGEFVKNHGDEIHDVNVYLCEKGKIIGKKTVVKSKQAFESGQEYWKNHRTEVLKNVENIYTKGRDGTVQTLKKTGDYIKANKDDWTYSALKAGKVSSKKIANYYHNNKDYAKGYVKGYTKEVRSNIADMNNRWKAGKEGRKEKIHETLTNVKEKTSDWAQNQKEKWDEGKEERRKKTREKFENVKEKTSDWARRKKEKWDEGKEDRRQRRRETADKAKESVKSFFNRFKR